MVAVQRVTPIHGMHQGAALLVKTGSDTVAVHPGPDWYIDHQDMTLALKDQVQVVGSAATLQGSPGILAAEVTRGDDRLVLRDVKTGAPAWSGSCRR